MEYIGDMRSFRMFLNGAYSVWIIHYNRTNRYVGTIAYADNVMRMITQKDVEDLNKDWSDIVQKSFVTFVQKYTWLQ